MKKFRCTVCGFIAENNAPDVCPVCAAPYEKFEEILEGEDSTAKNLVAHWDGETEEVGMYLAYAKQAELEGYPEVAAAFIKIAVEEGYHAAEIFEVQGKVKSTKENLAWRAEAEIGAQKAKNDAAKIAAEKGQEAAAEFFLRAARDEGRHGAMFAGLLKRYFG
jgi:rubrerythrin